MLSLIIFFASQTPSPPPSPSPSLPPLSPLTSCWCEGFEGTGGLVPGDTFCNRNTGGPEMQDRQYCISVSSHWPEGHLETLEPLPGSLCPSDFTHCVYQESIFAECSLCSWLLFIGVIVLLVNIPVAILAIWHKRHHPDESWWASYKSALGCLCCFVLAFVGGALRGGGGGGHDHHHADHHEDHL